MRHEPMHIETDVLIVGAGGAGMYAAIAAARAGCGVHAGRQQPDRPRRRDGHGADDGGGGARRARSPTTGAHHLDDTLAAGRGLCDEQLARAALRGRAGVHPRDG